MPSGGICVAIVRLVATSNQCALLDTGRNRKNAHILEPLRYRRTHRSGVHTALALRPVPLPANSTSRRSPGPPRRHDDGYVPTFLRSGVLKGLQN